MSDSFIFSIRAKPALMRVSIYVNCDIIIYDELCAYIYAYGFADETKH